MEEDRTKEEWNESLRRQFCDMFGPFEEFSERLGKGYVKHGIVRSKLKIRTAPFAPLQTVHDSPSHVSIHVALQSMRNLVVEEPLSALPTELLSLKATMSPAASSKGTPGKGPVEATKSGTKRRFDGSGEKQMEPRRKKTNNSDQRDEDDNNFVFSPDSGVHSNENEESVENMLNIMTSLGEPQLSPPRESFLKDQQREMEKMRKKEEKRKEEMESKFRIREDEKAKSTPRKEPEIEKKVEKKREKEKETPPAPTLPKVTLRFPDGSTTSSASTSREVSPEVSTRKPHRSQPAPVSGHVKLDVLKPDRIKKLMKLAESRGKLSRDDGSSKSEEKEKTPTNGRTSSRASSKLETSTPTPTRTRTPEASSTPRKPQQPPPLAASKERSERSERSEKSERSERPSRSETPQKPLNKTVHHLSAEVRQSPSTVSPRSIGSSMNTPTLLSRPSSSMSTHEPSGSKPPPRWTCQWEHSKLKTVQRIPLPDPTVPNQKSKGEFYHDLAKEWKSKADKSKDRVLRPLNYMLSSVFFILETIWKTETERTPQSRMHCASIYRDTYELLGVAISQGVRDSDDPLVVHLLPRIKILGQMMLSVMQYQMYVLRADQAIKTYVRLETPEVANSIDLHVNNAAAAPDSSTSQGWAASLANSSHSVTMPQVVYNMMRSQIKTANSLILASRYWEDSKSLTKQVDERFIKHHETICGRSIGMDTPFEQLAPFVLTAVASLKAEYEEELRLPVRPVLAKMKPVLDIAIRIGTFHSSAGGDRSHRTSQSTPRIPTATSTPQNISSV